MGPIAKKHAPFELVVYYPKTEEGKRELAERVAYIHAETVLQMIHKQDCPSAQKLQLVDTVVETAKRRDRDAFEEKMCSLINGMGTKCYTVSIQDSVIHK